MKALFKITVAGVLAAFVIVSAYGVGLRDGARPIEKNTPPASFVKPLRQDPELVKIANRLGLDVSQLNLFYNPDLQAGNLDGAWAVFTPPNTIEIKPGTRAEDVMVAHEMFHYLWTLQSQEEINDAVVHYNKYLKNDPWVQDRLGDYHSCDVECEAEEANAYICTEMPIYRLTQEFNDYCNYFIPNRAILFNSNTLEVR